MPKVHKEAAHPMMRVLEERRQQDEKQFCLSSLRDRVRKRHSSCYQCPCSYLRESTVLPTCQIQETSSRLIKARGAPLRWACSTASARCLRGWALSFCRRLLDWAVNPIHFLVSIHRIQKDLSKEEVLAR
jgi:hypothetical protein